MKLKVNQKIILIILIIILFFGLMASFFVFFKVKSNSFDKEYQNLFNNIENKGLLVDKDFFETKTIISKVSTLAEIKKYLAKTDIKLQDENILDILSSYNFNNNFSAIYILDKQGNAVVSTDQSFVGKNYSFRPYFKEAKKDDVFIYAAKGVTSQEIGCYFSTIIYDDKDQQLGVLVFKLKPEIIYENFQQQKFEIDLIDPNGIIIFSNQKEKILKSLGTISKENKTNIDNNNIYPGVEIKELNYQSIQKKLRIINEVEKFEYYDNNRQQKIILIKKTKETPFYLMIESSTLNIYDEANKIGLTIAVLVGLAALTAYLFIFLFLKRILSPLDKITNVSQKIVDGQLDQRVFVKTGDEFEVLADNFNKVTESLIEKNVDIQKQVDKKTADLNRINKYFVKRELRMIELKQKIKQLTNKK